MIFCNHDISKTITAMSFKLGQIIEDMMSIDILVKVLKSYFIFELLSIANFWH